MISELKNNINLPEIVRGSGVELTRRGARHVGLCPFHGEKTPSFFVFEDQHFKCFGCGEHGDVIDFIQKLHSFSFQDALKHLGIEQGPVTPAVKRDVRRRKRRSELIKGFRDWEERYCSYVSKLWRQIRKLMLAIPPEDLDLYAPLLHVLPVLEYHRDILIHGTDEIRFQLYKNKEALRCKQILT